MDEFESKIPQLIDNPTIKQIYNLISLDFALLFKDEIAKSIPLDQSKPEEWRDMFNVKVYG